MRLVVALGGNALLRRGEAMTAENQRANVAVAARSLAPVAGEHELVVTHGNGPQVGLLALQSAAYKPVAPYPLDVLGAESEGMIGYMIEQELRNALPGREVATLLTQIEVDPDDPAFGQPTKFIGPGYEPEEGARLADQRGWTMADDGGKARRVVASPLPRRILETRTIDLLLAAGVTVICAGGGGIPVVRRSDGSHAGIEAVIDKDRASALLAREIGAEGLVLLTDVAAVIDGFGTPGAREIRRASPAALAALDLPAGSMAPKAEAAAAFVAGGGRFAAIGALDSLGAILAGRAGTTVTAEACGLELA